MDVLRGRRLAAWLPLLAWSGVIFLVSARPSPELSSDPLLDVALKKAGHVVGFAITGLLAWHALLTSTHLRHPGAAAVALTFVIAVSDELHQAFVPGRHATLVDVLIDTAAAAGAVAVAAWIARRRAAHRAPEGAAPPNG